MARRKADSPQQPTEDQIRGLETTKASLEARIPALETARSAALDRRRETLIAGGDAADAAQAARAAEDDLAAVADALAEVDRRITEAVAKREAEDVQARREVVATALEADADRIVVAATAMAEAAEALTRAHAKMLLAVSGRAAPLIVEHRTDLSPKDFADGVLLQAVAAAVPGLHFEADIFPGHYTSSSRVEGRGAGDAGEIAAERLQDAAVRVRSEELPADLSEWQVAGPAIRVKEPKPVPVHPLRCFAWVDDRGQQRRSTPVDGFMPEPVVRAAIAAGVAVDQPTMATERAKRDWEMRRDGVSIERLFEGVDIVDLGVNLQAARKAEEQRQRDAWQAAQDAERAELEGRAA